MKAWRIFGRRSAAWLGCWLVLSPLAGQAAGDEVVVIYNSRMPESKAVAYHYAAMRKVPPGQIFGFELTTNEIISREDFTEQLQKPLADKLEASKLWRFGMVNIPATNGRPAISEERVVASRIRYAALCFGVPLKIAPSSLLEEVAMKITNDQLRRNEAAVDSELAWLPLVKTKVSLTGPLANPFYGVTNRTLLNCTNGILLVSRLDGPTVEIANGLVDKAVEAESNGLWGRAYFDARGLAETNSYFEGDQWMMKSAEICRLAGFDVTTDTNAATFPATFPMSQIAIYAGWYASTACGPFLAPKMEFMPGAFAYHLYSFSADRLRGDLTVNWCGALLAKGATCTMGCVYEPYMQFTPNIAFFLFVWMNNFSFGEAAWASQRTLSWQITVIGDPLYQPGKTSPQKLYSRLAREKNPSVAWLLERAANLNLMQGARLEQVVNFIEEQPVTRQSAVLTEKLADLYERQGKPASAIDTWERALQLNPSPQQRIRLRLALAQKLLAAHRETEAADNWRQFIAEAPDYPGIENIRKALRDLEQKIARAK